MALLTIKSKNTNPDASNGSTLSPVESDAVGLTPKAAAHVLELLRKEGKSKGVLRFGVTGGGCSGLSYHFTIEDGPSDNDLVFAAHGAELCVDPRSMQVVGGSTIDFDASVLRRSFVVHSPRAKKGCSCGASFTL